MGGAQALVDTGEDRHEIFGLAGSIHGGLSAHHLNLYFIN
jgi:hypothetical protein